MLRDTIIKKVLFVARSHMFLALLIVYECFLMFFHMRGSFQGDEAIYSQVARESIANESYLSFWWKGAPWFEKPPLVIWLTVVAFKLFGISEISAHIFPAFFGVAGVVVAYCFGVELFGNKKAGFLSGFILATTPMYQWSARSNMMDVPLSVFMALSMLAAVKAMRSKTAWWWMVFWVAVAAGTLAKSVVGLLPVPFIVLYILWKRQKQILWSKHFLFGAAAFFMITLPWHVFMSIRHGQTFWNDYLGYHVIHRFDSQFFYFPQTQGIPYYLGILFGRSSIWFLVVLVLVSYGIVYWKRYEKRIGLLISWSMFLLILFSLAKTKIAHYILPAFYPISVIGGGLFSEVLGKRSKILLLLLPICLSGLHPSRMLHVANTSEAHLLFPKAIVKFAGMNATIIVALLAALLGLWLFNNQRHTFSKYFFVLLIGVNMLIPFYPLRNEDIKRASAVLASLNNNQPVILYLERNWTNEPDPSVYPFYLPLGSNVEHFGTRTFMPLDKNSYKEGAAFCFWEKSLISSSMKNQALINTDLGSYFYCVEKK